MAYLSVNRDGSENISNSQPDKDQRGCWVCIESIEGENIDYTIELPIGTIFKIIGRNMTYSDLPIEIY